MHSKAMYYVKQNKANYDLFLYFKSSQYKGTNYSITLYHIHKSDNVVSFFSLTIVLELLHYRLRNKCL